MDVSTPQTQNNPEQKIRIISASSKRTGNIFKETYKYLKWMYARRSLIGVITKVELKRSIVQTKLSYLWWLLDPLLNFFCYLFLVTLMARSTMNNSFVPYPLFIITAILPWHFSMKTVINSASIWDKYSALIRQLRFPYIGLIISVLLYDLTLYLVSLIIVFFAIYLYDYPATIFWCYLPLIILLHVMLSFGLMLVNSMLAFVFYDYRKLLPFIMRIWFFLSPAIWSINMLPDRYKKLVYLNPMTFIFESYRNVLLYGISPNWKHVEYFSVFTLLLIGVGLILFVRREHYINRYI